MSNTPSSIDSSRSSQLACDLCGLSLRHGCIEATFSGKIYAFCCNGCRQVFNILLEASNENDPANFKNTELFRQCREKGIIPRSEADLAGPQPAFGSSRPEDLTPVGAETGPVTSPPSDSELDLVLKVDNMWCPACAWLIDESLKKTGGIIHSACNFSTDRLHIRYNPVQTSPARIIQNIARLGYRTAEPDDSSRAAERKKEFVRFAISAFLTMNIMMLSWSLYSGFLTEFSPETRH